MALSQLFLSLTLYAMVREPEGMKYAAYAGCALAMAVNCRPVNILIAFPIMVYMFVERRRHRIAFLLATLPPFLMFAQYPSILVLPSRQASLPAPSVLPHF